MFNHTTWVMKARLQTLPGIARSPDKIERSRATNKAGVEISFEAPQAPS
jgi:hypothetical protein